jgi:hypothetical protein
LSFLFFFPRARSLSPVLDEGQCFVLVFKRRRTGDGVSLSEFAGARRGGQLASLAVGRKKEKKRGRKGKKKERIGFPTLISPRAFLFLSRS